MLDVPLIGLHHLHLLEDFRRVRVIRGNPIFRFRIRSLGSVDLSLHAVNHLFFPSRCKLRLLIRSLVDGELIRHFSDRPHLIARNPHDLFLRVHQCDGVSCFRVDDH